MNGIHIIPFFTLCVHVYIMMSSILKILHNDILFDSITAFIISTLLVFVFIIICNIIFSYMNHKYLKDDNWYYYYFDYAVSHSIINKAYKKINKTYSRKEIIDNKKVLKELRKEIIKNVYYRMYTIFRKELQHPYLMLRNATVSFYINNYFLKWPIWDNEENYCDFKNVPDKEVNTFKYSDEHLQGLLIPLDPSSFKYDSDAFNKISSLKVILLDRAFDVFTKYLRFIEISYPNPANNLIITIPTYTINKVNDVVNVLTYSCCNTIQIKYNGYIDDFITEIKYYLSTPEYENPTYRHRIGLEKKFFSVKNGKIILEET